MNKLLQVSYLKSVTQHFLFMNTHNNKSDIFSRNSRYKPKLALKVIILINDNHSVDTNNSNSFVTCNIFFLQRKFNNCRHQSRIHKSTQIYTREN